MSVLHVLFSVGDSQYVLPAHEVAQMEGFEGATPVPGAPEYVRGLVQIRGRVIPVVDLRARFGLPPAGGDAGRRVIVVQHGDRMVGLLADVAREVVRLDPGAFQPPPEIVQRQSARFVRAVAKLGDRLVMLLESERVIGQEELDGDEGS